MNTQTRLAIAAAAMTVLMAGCATGGGMYGGQQSSYPSSNMPQDGGPDPSNDRTKKGAIIGAAVGAVAGLLSGDDATERRQRALVGAGVGGLAGGAIGNYQDRQERALRDRMAGTGVDVVRQGDNITLNMPSNITFGFDSASLNPSFHGVLDNVVSTLREYDQTIVEVAGHTDNVGTDAYNQKLSEQRAASVGSYLMGRGLNRERFITVGAGEGRPVASNESESGRAQNRRVEITLVPVRS